MDIQSASRIVSFCSLSDRFFLLLIAPLSIELCTIPHRADRSLHLRVSRFVVSLFVHAFLSFCLDHVYSEMQVRPSVKSQSNYCSLVEVFPLKMLKVPLAYQKTTFHFHLNRGICWSLSFSEVVLLCPGVPCLTLLCCSQSLQWILTNRLLSILHCWRNSQNSSKKETPLILSLHLGLHPM